MQTHLYRHFNLENELLYIGISKDAITRLKQHSGDWVYTVARSEVTIFQTREAALAAEADAIRAERPKFNVSHLPQSDRREQHSMTSKQYREAIRKLGMSQGEAADFLGISIRSSNGYANGRLIPEHIAKLLRLMIRLDIEPKDV
jgi:predicted GIY-YIG superfamily endonuclease